MIRPLCILLLSGLPAFSDTIVAARTIPAQTILSEMDFIVAEQTTPGAAQDPADIIGMEARVALFAGRPIRIADLTTPAVVERNQIVSLQYEKYDLIISTEGRALGRAGPGDTIRVMNIGSRATVSARIGNDGTAYVLR
jgi:flagella basal body P-ring formation protein FlgA